MVAQRLEPNLDPDYTLKFEISSEVYFLEVILSLLVVNIASEN